MNRLRTAKVSVGDRSLGGGRTPLAYERAAMSRSSDWRSVTTTAASAKAAGRAHLTRAGVRRAPASTLLATRRPRNGSSGSRRRPWAKGQTRVSAAAADRKSTRLNSSHLGISYAVFCLKKKSAAIRRERDDREAALAQPPERLRPGRRGRASDGQSS